MYKVIYYNKYIDHKIIEFYSRLDYNFLDQSARLKLDGYDYIIDIIGEIRMAK